MIAGIGLNPMGFSHYTDHLAVVCVLMRIPLLFTDESHLELAKRLYVDLKCELYETSELTARRLVKDYDVLLVSDLWSQSEYLLRFGEAEKFQHKGLRVMHCPHGYSDKHFWLSRCAEEDIALIYGQRMAEMLAEVPSQRHATYVVTGNLRYRYYKQHQDHLDATVDRDIFSRFAKPQPTILYAPTWQDQEKSTSFFDAADPLINQLPDAFNLVVKLHPQLEEIDLAEVYLIMAKYENKGNVVFVRNYPLVYPLLARCDHYIGDRSAVGYDFLAFNRPMYFLQQKETQDYLFQCGVTIAREHYDQIWTILECEGSQERYSSVRAQVYEEAFAADKDPDALRYEIVAACQAAPIKTGWRR